MSKDYSRQVFRECSWIPQGALPEIRRRLRECPDEAAKGEGLACLKGAKAGHLCNLIPQDHPDRIAAMKWITSFIK